MLALAAIAVPVVAGLREDAAGERERAARARTALEAAERVRLGATRARSAPRARRRAPATTRSRTAPRSSREGEALIAADARERVAAGTIDGDIKRRRVQAVPDHRGRRAAEQDAGTPRGRYDCVAYKRSSRCPSSRASRAPASSATRTGWSSTTRSAKLAWCKVTPRAGEGGRSLAAVPVPEPCRDPPGPG